MAQLALAWVHAKGIKKFPLRSPQRPFIEIRFFRHGVFVNLATHLQNRVSLWNYGIAEPLQAHGITFSGLIFLKYDPTLMTWCSWNGVHGTTFSGL